MKSRTAIVNVKGKKDEWPRITPHMLSLQGTRIEIMETSLFGETIYHGAGYTWLEKWLIFREFENEEE